MHLRATVFYENLRSLVRLSLPAHGAVRLPWGSESTMLPLVAGEDVARVAVGLLTSPSLPAGASYRVIGATLALRDIIATLGRVLGRDVRYEEIPDDEWRRNAVARGVNQHAVEHLSQLWRARSAGLDRRKRRFAVTVRSNAGRCKTKNLRGIRARGRSALTAQPADCRIKGGSCRKRQWTGAPITAASPLMPRVASRSSAPGNIAG